MSYPLSNLLCQGFDPALPHPLPPRGRQLVTRFRKSRNSFEKARAAAGVCRPADWHSPRKRQGRRFPVTAEVVIIIMKTRLRLVLLSITALTLFSAAPAVAQQDRLCDPGGEDCRSILINYIRNEKVAIDVAFWFMEDARYSNELIKKVAAGVPVRVLMDPRANASYPLNAERLQELQDAGIPMRKRLTSYILHWKTMLFHGQNVVEFSGANFSADAWRPATTIPYENYTDESIYFTSDTRIVDSFRKKFDDAWVDTTNWANYANISSPLTRRYDETLTIDPSMNFPPEQNYRTRSVAAYKAEKRKIDVIMYRITDRQHTDNILAAVARGVKVRLITEPKQYRDPTRLWHSWNVDRLYMGGVEIKHRAHAGLNHQKSVILYDQNGSASGDQSMVIFGSSNWTSPSAAGQVEHNIFTTKPDMVSWFVDQFERKWNNTGGVIENVDFVPLPPDTPKTPSPATGATGVSTTVTLKWYGGPWAHLYDVYFGTTSSPPLVASDLALGPSDSSTKMQSYQVPVTLTGGTTYYWRIVAKTMALQTKTSAVWSFTTAGGAPPPPPPPSPGPDDIVMYASEAPVKAGAWKVVSDSTAAGGAKLRNPNSGAAKITTAAANPASYFEMTFDAEAGKGYHLWMRGRADGNSWANDSVFVQFSGTVNSSGSAQYRIGTTSAAEYNLEDCSGCGVSGWGWQDNGYGGMGPLLYFATSGQQTIRVQPREDGLSIDQIVLSASNWVSSSPGALKNDTTILTQTVAGGTTPDPSSADVVLYASRAPIVVGSWSVVSDSSAAGGEKIRNPNGGVAKITTAAADPASYFEMTFDAEAGQGYHLWMRGRADNNSWANDSVFVQFSGTVQSGSPIYRIGTTSAAEYNLEDCSGCGLSGWGWQDNGYNGMGPLLYFATSGTQRLRVQPREDGLSIDQIVLSPTTFASASPGALKNDSTILASTQ